MEDLSRNGLTSIMNLPDECLVCIYQYLNRKSDRDSFGLTCRQWLCIQNSSQKSLQFYHPHSELSFPSQQRMPRDIESSHLNRMLLRYQHLESLALIGCTKLDDSGFTQLLHCGSKLRLLHLDGCFNITDHALHLVGSGCPLLVVICLYWCYQITDTGLQSLANFCQHLTHVDLSYCCRMSDKGLNALVQGCHQLYAIRISHCQGLRGVGFKDSSQNVAFVEAEYCCLAPEGLVGILGGHGIEYVNVSRLIFARSRDPVEAIGLGFVSSLKILNLRLCRNIGDEIIVAISKGCPLLQEWNLALCNGVMLPGWISIASNCHNLERLHVNRCHNLCDEGLQALRDGCKRLTVLYLTACSRITHTALEVFKLHRGDVNVKEEEIIHIGPGKWPFSKSH